MFDAGSVEAAGLAAHATTSFPSPATDYYRGPVSLDAALIPRPASTFVLRVAGDGLRSAGILDGDELVVDRSLGPATGRVVVAVIDSCHRVGLLRRHTAPDPMNESVDGPGWWLVTDESQQAIPAGSVFFGVVTVAIHHLLPGPGRG